MTARFILLQAAIVCLALSTTNPTAQPSDQPPDRPEGSQATDGSSPRSADRPYWRTNLFGRFFRDQGYLFKTWWPEQFRRPAFTSTVLAGVAFAADSASSPEGPDRELEEYIRGASWGGQAGPTWHGFTKLGDGSTGALLLGAGYLFGRWCKNDRLAEASSLSAEALLSAGLYSTVLKGVFARTRPQGNGRGDFFKYNPPAGQVSGSFPSGHATGAFTVATVFAGTYADHRWVPWVAYGTAGLIGTSRIALARHFPSDVVVGAALGHSIGRMVMAHQAATGRVVSRFDPFVDLSRQEAGVFWTRRW